MSVKPLVQAPAFTILLDLRSAAIGLNTVFNVVVIALITLGAALVPQLGSSDCAGDSTRDRPKSRYKAEANAGGSSRPTEERTITLATIAFSLQSSRVGRKHLLGE